MPLTNWMTLRAAMGRLRFVALDSRDTMYLSSAGSFEEASHVRLEMAKLATETMFDRTPDGYVDGDRMERLFNPVTTALLLKSAARDSEIFKSQQIHQSVETGTVRELQVDDNTALLSVEGQILRVGTFNGRVQPETKKVTVFLRLTLNSDIAHNGRYPLVVTDYQERF